MLKLVAEVAITGEKMKIKNLNLPVLGKIVWFVITIIIVDSLMIQNAKNVTPLIIGSRQSLITTIRDFHLKEPIQNLSVPGVIKLLKKIMFHL